ncbi:MAG: hypothetical protein IMY73_04885, partial [Bacteroidetes bacterium]|nr:hypothetical protein [Bacteroidota bacterium]
MNDNYNKNKDLSVEDFKNFSEEEYENLSGTDFDNLSADELDELMKGELANENQEEQEKQEKKRKPVTDKKVPTRKGEGKSLSLEVDEKSPADLMSFLRDKMKDKSRTTIKSYLTHRQISINEIPTTQFNHELVAGDIVTLNFGLSKDTFKNPFLRIVYEDDYIIVIDKRNGLLSMATDRERQKTAYYILSEYLTKQNRNNRIFIVHRLDRET